MMQYLIILSYFLILKENVYVTAYSDGVTLDSNWPVGIQVPITFSIAKHFNDQSVLVIELSNQEKLRKVLRISRPQYADILTEYFTIKKEIIKKDTFTFSVKMLFLRKSHNLNIIFRWFPSGVEVTNEEILSEQRNIIYQSPIKLREKWKIKITIEIMEIINNEKIFYQEERFFQHGKTAKITCSAFDGLPQERVHVNGIHTKRFRETAYDELLNTWIGYITLNVNDHNSNISCYVAGTDDIKTIQIKVNHPTTALILEPEYTGFVKNGSRIKCIPFDGYPPPLIKWDFVSVKNHSNPKMLYQIQNDELLILPDAALGTQMEFNCTAIYTNPFFNEISVMSKKFQFDIGEGSNNIELMQTTAFVTTGNQTYEKLNKAAIGAGVAGIIIMIIAISIVVMLCRSKPKPANSSTHRQEGSPKYAGSLLAGSRTVLHNQVKDTENIEPKENHRHNGASSAFIPSDTNISPEPNEFNYDDMPRGRKPIKVVMSPNQAADDSVVYSTIIGTMQPKPSSGNDQATVDRRHHGHSFDMAASDTNTSSDQGYGYDDKSQSRRPLMYPGNKGSTHQKLRPSLDLGPIDRV